MTASHISSAEERDAALAFRCCAVIGSGAAILPVCSVRSHTSKNTVAWGGLGWKEYAFSTKIELTNCRHGRVRIGTALYGLRVTDYWLPITGYDSLTVALTVAWSVCSITGLPRFQFKCRKFKCDLANCWTYLNRSASQVAKWSHSEDVAAPSAAGSIEWLLRSLHSVPQSGQPDERGCPEHHSIFGQGYPEHGQPNGGLRRFLRAYRWVSLEVLNQLYIKGQKQLKIGVHQ